MRLRKGEEPAQGYAKLRRTTERPRRPRRVLMIDASRVDRLLVSAALVLKARVETRLTEVVDFDLGLSLLLQRDYDLILLEDAIPGYPPWEVTRAIRGVAPTTPIVRHGQYLDGNAEDGNGLDALVEAVNAALMTGRVTRSSASAPWTSASAVS